MDTKPCAHRWESRGWTGAEMSILCEWCRKCGEDRQRAACTPELLAHLKAQDAQWKMEATGANVHALWHDFAKNFLDGGDWLYTGWDLLQRVEKWAEAHPEVVITGCDDQSFMGSDIVLIPHAADRRWMGISLVTIPQNGERPGCVFLYPQHQDALIMALLGLRRTRRPLKRLENADEARRQREYAELYRRDLEQYEATANARGRS